MTRMAAASPNSTLRSIRVCAAYGRWPIQGSRTAAAGAAVARSDTTSGSTTAASCTGDIGATSKSSASMAAAPPPLNLPNHAAGRVSLKSMASIPLYSHCALRASASNPRLQEFRAVRETAYGQLVPQYAVGIPQPLLGPGIAGRFGFIGEEIADVAQAGQPLNQQGGVDVKALGQQHQPGFRRHRGGRAAGESGEVDDGKQVAADIDQPAEPRLGQRHRGQRSDGDHFLRLVQPQQPALSARLDSQAR